MLNITGLCLWCNYGIYYIFTYSDLDRYMFVYIQIVNRRAYPYWVNAKCIDVLFSNHILCCCASMFLGFHLQTYGLVTCGDVTNVTLHASSQPWRLLGIFDTRLSAETWPIVWHPGWSLQALTPTWCFRELILRASLPPVNHWCDIWQTARP